jgi:hypothetical protein
VEGSGRGLILRSYKSICMEGVQKTTKNVCQDSYSPWRDLKQGPPEHEAGILPTESQRSLVDGINLLINNADTIKKNTETIRHH